MNRRELVDAVRKARNGSRKVQLTFRKDAENDLQYLRGMIRSGIISLDPEQEKIFQTTSWNGEESSRTCVVGLTQKFDEQWFVSQLERAIENATAVAV